MTFIQSIHPDAPATLAHEALAAEFDERFPQWEIAEGMGDRFITERDLPIYDDSADLARVSNDDWEMFFGSR